MGESRVFVELLILFGATTLVATLCHYARLPTIIGFILAGVIVGPSGAGLVDSLPNADGVAEIAVIFLMFTIGLEFSFKRLLELKRDFLRLGVLQVALTIMLVAVAARLIGGISLPKAVYFGFLVSLSSTALVMKLLQDTRDVESPYGKHALSILLFQDLAVIPMMLALPLLTGEQNALLLFQPEHVLNTVGKVLGVLLGLWLATRYVIPFILERVVKTRSREVFFSSVLFLLMGVAYLFELGGLSLGLGAFAAGMMISEGPYGRQATSDILPLRDNFLGLFFASIGMLLDLGFVWEHLPQIVGLSALLFLIKGIVLLTVCSFARTPISVAAVVALILNQIGEFSFILASRGVEIGLMSAGDNQYFLAVSVLSMVFTPFLFMLAPRIALAQRFGSWKSLATSDAGRELKAQLKAKTQDKRKSGDSDGHGHVILIGFGICGQNMAAALSSLKIKFKAIELNYDSVKTWRKRGIDIEFGDATSAEVLEHAGIEGAGLVVIAVSGPKILPAVIASIRRARPDVQVIVRAQYVREIEELRKDPRLDIVIAEIETAVELLARALKVYGVESDEIRQYMTQARSQLSTFTQIASSLQSPTLNLPSWEALAAIKPMRIGDGYAAVERSLAELDLPRATGTSVVSVFRDGLGTTVPDGQFVLKAGDVAHLIGSPDALRAAEKLLRGS